MKSRVIIFILSLASATTMAETVRERITNCQFNVHQSTQPEEMRALNLIVNSPQSEIESTWKRLIDKKIGMLKACYSDTRVEELVVAAANWKALMEEKGRDLEGGKITLERFKETANKGEIFSKQLIEMNDTQTKMVTDYNKLVDQWRASTDFMERNRLEMQMRSLGPQIYTVRMQMKNFYFQNRVFVDSYRTLQLNLNNLQAQLYGVKYYGDQADVIAQELKNKLYELTVRNPQNRSDATAGINSADDLLNAGERIATSVEEFSNRAGQLQQQLNDNVARLREMQDIAGQLSTW